MEDVLIIINKLLNSKLRWAIFGGVAIAIRYGDFYRTFDDIDIIIEDNDEKLNRFVPNITNCNRGGRKKRCARFNNVLIEFMLMTGKDEIDLADRKFRFKNIE